MAHIPEIYAPKLCPPPGFPSVVSAALEFVKRHKYVHVCKDQPFFLSTVAGGVFLSEVMAQHAKAYFDHYDCTELAEVIGSSAPLLKEALCDGTFSVSTISSLLGITNRRLWDLKESADLRVKQGLLFIAPNVIDVVCAIKSGVG